MLGEEEAVVTKAGTVRRKEEGEEKTVLGEEEEKKEEAVGSKAGTVRRKEEVEEDTAWGRGGRGEG